MGSKAIGEVVAVEGTVVKAAAEDAERGVEEEEDTEEGAEVMVADSVVVAMEGKEVTAADVGEEREDTAETDHQGKVEIEEVEVEEKSSVVDAAAAEEVTVVDPDHIAEA